MSEWAAPIVPVLKPDGAIRICGDYKLTINRAAKPDVYPLPWVEDLFATLSGGKSFTKLNLAERTVPNSMLQSTPIRGYIGITGYPLVYQLLLLFFNR